MRTTTRKALALVAAVTLVAAAAVGSVATSGAASASSGGGDFAPKLSFPMTITTPAGTITLSKAPHRIISLSPTATEILFAIGAGKQVVAVDDDSDYPTHGLPKKRFNAFSPNVEEMLALHPDLVVVSYNPDGLEAKLQSAGVPVMEQDAAVTLRDTYQQITWLGDATGHYKTSLAVAETDRRDIARDVAKVPKHHKPLRVYFELDPQLYSLTSMTYAGRLLADLGATNIADDAAGASLSGGYPQLSAEFVVKENPQMIFLADTICCHQSYKTVAARYGWFLISAVKHHEVIKLNDDIASRWGPRVSILMGDLTAAVLRYYKT